MKKVKRTFWMYLLLICVLVTLIVWVLVQGTKLEAPGVAIVSNNSPATSFLPDLSKAMQVPLALFILQIITIILVARMAGYVAAQINQPQVVGEIVAGIILGPSLLGWIAPDFAAFLFPSASLNNLHFLSQLGLILLMFIIGMELDLKQLKNQAKVAVVISHAGIIFPYSLGVVLSYLLYQQFASPGISFISFALFIGIAMSITAFPVLARIIQERGLSKTPFGSLALTCAAADDITAWCILAVVIALVKAEGMLSVVYTVLLSAAYVATMFLVVQPLLRKLGAAYASRETFNRRVVGLILLVLLASAWAAEVIGIHALFGAFLAGVVMPRNLSFKKIITDKIEDVSLVLLLPLFFISTGLRTHLNMLVDQQTWLPFLVILFIAILGKFGGGTLAARMMGQSWKDSLSLGALMNTRGLMELVVLNIGYELGILSQEIFTMMVLMALITTFLTGPVLSFIERRFSKEDFGAEVLARLNTSLKILISFGPPKMGSTLLRLADQLTLKFNKNVDITALHITPSSDVKPYEATLFEKEGFQPIRSTAQLLGMKLNTLYRSTEDVDGEISDTVEQGHYDLVLVGAARPMFTQKTTGGILKQLLDKSQTNMGVLVDRGFVMAESVLLLLGSEDDMALLPYAYRFKVSNKARITILKIGDALSLDIYDKNSPYYWAAENFTEVIEQRIPDKELLRHFNLIMVGLEQWNELNDIRTAWISDCPSIFVVKHFQDLPIDAEQKPATEKKHS